jgi:hypothetical protein
LKSDGSLDSGWGNSGLREIDFNTSRDQPNALAIDNMGRLMMAGGVRRGNSFDFGLTRLYMPSTGIADLNNAELGLSIYPNPAATSEVWIALPKDRTISNTLMVYDAEGRIVYSKKTMNLKTSMANTLELDVSGLSGGIYLVELKGAKATYRGKLMIAK